MTTTGSKEDALRISKELVEYGLIACAQIEQIESVYLWEDKMHHDDEYRVTMKHAVALAEDIRSRILMIHPYDVPEVITWEARTTPSYRKWVENQSV